MSAREINKHAHGRYTVAVDVSAADYEALTDGYGLPIAFQLNVSEGVDLSVKPIDSSTFVTMHFAAGDNPTLLKAVENQSTTVTLLALYPYKPATTTVNTEY
jgi:hypothetical protein